MSSLYRSTLLSALILASATATAAPQVNAPPQIMGSDQMQAPAIQTTSDDVSSSQSASTSASSAAPSSRPSYELPPAATRQLAPDASGGESRPSAIGAPWSSTVDANLPVARTQRQREEDASPDRPSLTVSSIPTGSSAPSPGSSAPSPGSLRSPNLVHPSSISVAKIVPHASHSTASTHLFDQKIPAAQIQTTKTTPAIRAPGAYISPINTVLAVRIGIPKFSPRYLAPRFNEVLHASSVPIIPQTDSLLKSPDSVSDAHQMLRASPLSVRNIAYERGKARVRSVDPKPAAYEPSKRSIPSDMDVLAAQLQSLNKRLAVQRESVQQLQKMVKTKESIALMFQSRLEEQDNEIAAIKTQLRNLDATF